MLINFLSRHKLASENKWKEIPGAEELEHSFRINKAISLSILLLVSLIDLVMICFFLVVQDPAFYLLGFFAIVISFFSFKKDYIVFFKRKKQRLDKIREKKIGNYTIDEIQAIVKSIISRFQDKEVPKIYIVDEPMSGPYVIDTYLFNFVGPLNAIYLPKQDLIFLKPDELKAIIAHELGHFYRYMYPVQRFTYPFYLLVSLLPFILLPFVHRLVFAVILIAVNIGFNPILFRLFNHKSKSLEYLCDLFAAKLCGKLNTINALLVSSKYSELIELLEKKILLEIKANDSLSIASFDQIFDKLIRIVPFQPDSIEDVDHILTHTLAKFDYKSFKVDLTEKEIMREEGIITKLLGQTELAIHRKILDWEKFDFVERNYRIEPQEYDYLIKSLIESEDFLVDSITDDESDEITSTHPSLRHRILFLDKNIEALNTPGQFISI